MRRPKLVSLKMTDEIEQLTIWLQRVAAELAATRFKELGARMVKVNVLACFQRALRALEDDEQSDTDDDQEE